MPGTGHLLVQRHTDSDYHHQPNELNVWLPLTRAAGSNTLWAESAPGLGDFHPFELVPGQAMLFYGIQCAHYTVPNETSTTRASVDFRVVPSACYRHRYPCSHRSDGMARFARGAYFGTLNMDMGCGQAGACTRGGEDELCAGITVCDLSDSSYHRKLRACADDAVLPAHESDE